MWCTEFIKTAAGFGDAGPGVQVYPDSSACLEKGEAREVGRYRSVLRTKTSNEDGYEYLNDECTIHQSDV
jgi:hypothetical protein